MTETPGADVPVCYRHTDREAHIRCQRCGRTICPDCMHEASVGYQCPECVAEGRRATREPRAAYGGSLSGDPRITSGVLVAVNVGVWLAVLLTGGRGSRLVDLLALRPRGVCVVGDTLFANVQSCRAAAAGEWLPGFSTGAPWQVVTSAFAHIDVWHIGINMLILWLLGPQLEAVLGRWRFLVLYLLSALTGSLAVLWLSAPYTPTLGASGAIFGLLGALLVVAFKVGGNYQQILMWLAINAVIGVVGRDFISWQGHLGGLVGGLLLALAFVYAPRPRRTVLHVAAVATLAVLTLLGMALRVALL